MQKIQTKKAQHNTTTTTTKYCYCRDGTAAAAVLTKQHNITQHNGQWREGIESISGI